jgi:hypothetical protein
MSDTTVYCAECGRAEERDGDAQGCSACPRYYCEACWDECETFAIVTGVNRDGVEEQFDGERIGCTQCTKGHHSDYEVLEFCFAKILEKAKAGKMVPEERRDAAARCIAILGTTRSDVEREMAEPPAKKHHGGEPSGQAT